jgi:hypothetical protein
MTEGGSGSFWSNFNSFLLKEVEGMPGRCWLVGAATAVRLLMGMNRQLDSLSAVGQDYQQMRKITLNLSL